MSKRANRHQTWSNDAIIASGAADSTAEHRAARRAWLQLGGALLSLAVLASALPGPATIVSVLTGTSDHGVEPTQLVATVALTAASVLIWALLAWGVLIAGAALSGHVPGVGGEQARRLLGRIAPAAARRLVVSMVGVSLISGLAVGGAATASAASPGPAAAQSVHHRSGNAAAAATASATSWTSVEGSEVQLKPSTTTARATATNVDRPIAPSGPPLDIDWPHAPGASGNRTAAPVRTVDVDWPKSTEPVVVLRGDSLWSIAAAHLPSGASRADIDQAWHRWYAANKSVIGEDPDLILPGQILLPPTQPNGN